ncbi:16786_t:CDS:2 [Funneliformis geosporum]|uniref:14512_t:CDS:1 n=1 Tax=Funneliformis geosporum TaxID=1117311 RepID=A0A9W4WJA6_9GLOM|nr:16786_t:CDS:2 [Funneliformis geosporum]CAI2165898.1 14512_t:CDS:2 [Funneliformis geosporum]
MNAESIWKSYSIGKDKQLLELAWQIEFYQTITQSWTIELLQNGADASCHKSHFESGGIYESIRNVCKKWVIIDIQCPDFCNGKPKYSSDYHWINIYCLGE